MTLEEALRQAGYEPSAARALAMAAQDARIQEGLNGAAAVLAALRQAPDADTPMGQAFFRLVSLICQQTRGGIHV